MTNQCFCHKPELLDGLCELHFVQQNITPLEKERTVSQTLVNDLTKSILVQQNKLRLALGLLVVGFRGIPSGTGYTNEGFRRSGTNLYCHRKGCNFVTESGIDMARHEADHPPKPIKTSETRLVSRACQRGQHNFCITARCGCEYVSCGCSNPSFEQATKATRLNQLLEDDLDGME